MYRFYAEVAGATIREIDYRSRDLEFPLEELLDAITPDTRAVLIANPNNPTGTGVALRGIERILKRAPQAAVLIDEAYLRILRRHRAAADRRVSEPVRQPHVFESLRHGGDAAGLPVLASRPTSRSCTRRSRPTA